MSDALHPDRHDSSQDRFFDCEGWWEQAHFGRQPMQQLRLQIEGQTIHGNGFDIIGLFTLSGSITPSGDVVIRKQYVGQHVVTYLGEYDGEGTLWGKWHLFADCGNWRIRFRPRAELDPPFDQIIPRTR